MIVRSRETGAVPLPDCAQKFLLVSVVLINILYIIYNSVKTWKTVPTQQGRAIQRFEGE